MEEARAAQESGPIRTGAIRARTEAKLLDAAEELFFTRGIAATPVDAVLAHAGVSAATLYRGYASKEALLAAALERRQRRWIQTWDAAIAGETTDAGKLLAVFSALEDFRRLPGGARWCAFLGSAAEYAGTSDEVAAAVEADTRALRERLTRLARPVAGDDAPELAERLLLVVSGELAMRLREPAPAAASTARAIAAVLVTRSTE